MSQQHQKQIKRAFEKGKLEERERIKRIIIKLREGFGAGKIWSFDEFEEQLQKEIGDNSQQSLGIGSLGKGTSDEGLHNPNSYVSNSPNSHPEKSRNELDTACLGLNKTNSGSDTKEIGGGK